jgi:hypothetical protein
MGKYCEIPDPAYKFFVRKRKHLWVISDLVTGMRLWDRYTQAQCLPSVAWVLKHEPKVIEEARKRHKDAEVINDENGLRDGIAIVAYHDGRKVEYDPDNWPEGLSKPESEE